MSKSDSAKILINLAGDVMIGEPMWIPADRSDDSSCRSSDRSTSSNTCIES